VIEQVMVFTLGFLVAGLLALAIAPAFWRRAIRLSTRRLEMQVPLSPAEILAGRDLLRAEFAVERRQLEQKAETLNLMLAANMAELGRRAAVIAAQQADLAALSHQTTETDTEFVTLQRALAESTAELATTAKEVYDVSGLVKRKDAELTALRNEFESAQALTAKQRTALMALETSAAHQKQALEGQAAKVEHLERELASLQLQHQADQVTLKAAAARIADHEEASEAAGKREKDLIQHRKLQVETARATERGYLEKIERLRSAHAASQDALEAARRTCEGLTRELAALHAATAPQAASTALSQREENEILRQKINDIGAAIIRMAVDAAGDAQAADDLPEDTIPAKATA
jgi:chromosome segregation ATPase